MSDPRSPLPDIGRGRIYYDGAVHDATWDHAEWLADYEVVVTLDDGRQLPVSDTEERLGFIYRAPDSGREMTNIMVLMGDGEADPAGVPTQAEVFAAAFPALQPLFRSVSAGETNPDDLDFCRQLFGSQAAMLRTVQSEGSLDAAHAKILRDIFRI